MSLFGPPNIEKMKAKRDVKGLIKALGYQRDAGVRKGAAMALGELKDSRAIEPLIAALKDRYYDVRQVVIKALEEIADARAVEPLIAALKGGDSGVRKAAVNALVKLGDARALDAIIAALKDSDKAVRETAAAALGQIGGARAFDALVAMLSNKDRTVSRPLPRHWILWDGSRERMSLGRLTGLPKANWISALILVRRP